MPENRVSQLQYDGNLISLLCSVLDKYARTLFQKQTWDKHPLRHDKTEVTYIRTRKHAVPSGGTSGDPPCPDLLLFAVCLSRSTFSCGSQTAVHGKTDAEEAHNALF